jgi:hypothetical protein
MTGKWLEDAIFLAGLALMAVGLSLWSVPLMLTVIGAVLMGLALIGAWRGRK